MNVLRIRALAAHMRHLPPELGYYQRVYFTRECGTATCIAGHAAALFGDLDIGDLAVDSDHIDRRASEALGLDRLTACDLFSAIPLPIEPLGGGHARLVDPTPETAARVLEILADTGEVDWKRAARETGQITGDTR